MLTPPHTPEHRRPSFHLILPQAVKVFCPSWNPKPDPRVLGEPRAPSAASALPAPGEEPAGDWPLSWRGGGRACASCPGFLSPARSRSSSLSQLLPQLHPALPPFQLGRAGSVHSAALTLGLVSAAPSPKSEAFRDPEGARGQERTLRPQSAEEEGGISPSFFLKRLSPTLAVFFFDPLASQEEVAELLALAQNEDLSWSPSTTLLCQQQAARGGEKVPTG